MDDQVHNEAGGNPVCRRSTRIPTYYLKVQKVRSEIIYFQRSQNLEPIRKGGLLIFLWDIIGVENYNKLITVRNEFIFVVKLLAINHSSNSLNLNKRKLIRRKVRSVWKAYYQNKPVILKECDSLRMTFEEFFNTQVIYKLLNKTMKVPKPLSFRGKYLVESYLPGETREWPLLHVPRKLCLSLPEYYAALRYLIELHNSKPPKSWLSLKVEQYGGCSLRDKLSDDYCKLKKLNSKISKEKINELKGIEKYIPSERSYLVLSHGDFKPDNLIINKSKGNIEIGAIDWIDLGLRQRQYDLGSLLFGLKCDTLMDLVDYYITHSKINVIDRFKFAKEAIAVACITHVNAPLGSQQKESDKRWAFAIIDYAYSIIHRIESTVA